MERRRNAPPLAPEDDTENDIPRGHASHFLLHTRKG